MRKALAVGAAGLGAAGLGAVAAFELRVHPMWRSWGVDPDEAVMTLPGDDLVPEPLMSDTRGITIDAPPADVWPWLVQMGYGRAGWYSYDALDMRGHSVRTIVPEWQQLAPGDVLPTDPAGGFQVKIVEPGGALVLFTDALDVNRRAVRRHGRGAGHGRSWHRPEPGQEAVEASAPPGLELSGGLLSSSVEGDFSASWAFVLRELEGGRTRLIERYRIALGERPVIPPTSRPILGLGVFIMTRRQMLGIRDRAEALARSREPAPSGGDPVAAGEATTET
jgi:hypothetical protein